MSLIALGMDKTRFTLLVCSIKGLPSAPPTAYVSLTLFSLCMNECASQVTPSLCIHWGSLFLGVLSTTYACLSLALTSLSGTKPVHQDHCFVSGACSE
ncbi:hypothetical protein EJ05DRAFT_48844 [Pseudovirgaria hyperparasitica]|uniref:Uncharacterized protein n=1 Tax=Pseudovirgaria hyperparasitica TaxID=470096 RepID=A0A6A6W4S3_9PEZI|nr:uncharacterized protein EJ05DRAFT_48844 [Pseudovirgaria hyperparasitica]KAF2756956.1 hypothetical protein EJ05DRAFT_48844 [Pseudovirgaria hyperparasitica]